MKVGDVMKQDKFEVLLEMQKELMSIIKQRTGELATLTDITVAMMTEVSEWANAHGEFKKWKLNHKYDREHVLEEFVDILFFWLQAMIMQNFTIVDIMRKYMEKYDENVRRQHNGY